MLAESDQEVGRPSAGRLPAGCAVVLVGTWRALGKHPAMPMGGITIYPCPPDPIALKQIALSTHPGWLLLGEDRNSENLLTLAVTARALLPRIRIAVLGPLDDLDLCAKWLRLGAHVYLSAGVSVQRMIAAMHCAARLGVAVFDQKFQQLGLEQQNNLHNLVHMLGTGDLTEREHQVIRLLRFGLKNTDIAAALGISKSTVEYHVSHILSKLHAANRTEAAAYATALNF